LQAKTGKRKKSRGSQRMMGRFDWVGLETASGASGLDGMQQSSHRRRVFPDEEQNSYEEGLFDLNDRKV
jgi:hypothetical protein